MKGVETLTNREAIRKEIENSLEEYILELSEEERREIVEEKEIILQKIMDGELNDVGGLIAMRGFVYQYYVAIYYMIMMLVPSKNAWWNAVILEYFDDVSLVGPESIRFIQVKTIREHAEKYHKESDLYSRSKLIRVDDTRKHFNSWIEKNFLNYDYFIESGNEENIERKSEKNPQFEIITNTSTNSLMDIKKYTNNINFDLSSSKGDSENDDTEQDKIHEAILKPIKDLDYQFTDHFLKEDKFYLNRLYINKLGSSKELYTDILNLIEEYIDESLVKSTSIAVYIFQKLLSKVIKNSHEDNKDRLDKGTLVIAKSDLKRELDKLKDEANNIIFSEVYFESALAIFIDILDELKDIDKDFSNQSLKTELLNHIEWLKNQILTNSQEDNTYCVSILNKLFYVNNNITGHDYKNSEFRSDLKESLRFIVYFSVFYDEHLEVFKNEKMIFQQAESSVIENILFTVFHARNSMSKIESVEKIKYVILESNEIRKLTMDLYCLLIGYEKDMENQEISDLFDDMNFTKTEDVSKKITDVTVEMNFIDSEELEVFFNEIKKREGSYNSFKQQSLLPTWKDYLEKFREK